MDKHYVWALPNTMEAFRIWVRDIALAVQMLVHLSEVTSAGLMERFRHLAELNELLDCLISLASLDDVYKDPLTAMFLLLRHIECQMDVELPPRASVITPELRLTK